MSFSPSYVKFPGNCFKILKSKTPDHHERLVCIYCSSEDQSNVSNDSSTHLTIYLYAVHLQYMHMVGATHPHFKIYMIKTL